MKAKTYELIPSSSEEGGEIKEAIHVFVSQGKVKLFTQIGEGQRHAAAVVSEMQKAPLLLLIHLEGVEEKFIIEFK